MISRQVELKPALLTVVILLAAIAVGPTTMGVITGLDSAATHEASPPLDRSALASDSTPAIATDERTATQAFGTLDHRLVTATDRVADHRWGSPLAVLLFGYTRQADGEPLEHEVRNRLFEQVRSTPGAHIADLAAGIDVPRSTVRYHLRVLEASGLLAGATIRGRHRYGPAGTDLELAAALYDEPTRAVIEAVARFEPLSMTGLAEEIDRAPSTVAHHLDHLEDVGLLARDTSAGQTDVRLDGPARDLETDRRARIDEPGVPAELPVE